MEVVKTKYGYAIMHGGKYLQRSVNFRSGEVVYNWLTSIDAATVCNEKSYADALRVAYNIHMGLI